MPSNDLHAQWISFCKGATPGTRYWLADELYARLWERLAQEQRFCSEVPAYSHSITYKGGYEIGGLTFYRRAIYPNPPRRAPGRQEFYAR
jgi:hypothetical protein